MNAKYAAVAIGIAIVIVVIVLVSQITISPTGDTKILLDTNQTEINIVNEDRPETDPNLPITEEDINKRLEEIKGNAENNMYTPQPREWITSGPFQIDRSKYVLGEKVFLRIGGVQPNEKGQIVFLRPLNQTHYSVYLSIPFDGTSKNVFNYYFEPRLSAASKICTIEQITGKWAVVFRGTNYPNLYFEVTDQILPGSEDTFSPVC